MTVELCFNSLFEMPRPTAVTKVDMVVLIAVSILYLRCTTRGVDDADDTLLLQVSILYLRCATSPWCRLACLCYVSILYLRCKR